MGNYNYFFNYQEVLDIFGSYSIVNFLDKYKGSYVLMPKDLIQFTLTQI